MAQPTSSRTRKTARRMLVAVLLTFIGACHRAVAIEQAVEARHLVAALQAELAQAVDASNRAVMTESDPASSDSTRDAEAARERVRSTERKLDGLLRGLQFANEQKKLADFRGKFAAYEVLDAKILSLAVEKSNVKATRLAFGPAREAADDFKEALLGLPGVADAKVRSVVLEATLAVRELQTLEPRHIAEPNDLAMTRMEEQMAALESAARAALQRASVLGAMDLQAATAALDRFSKANAEIVALSRRNTNVRSLELTLGQKRMLVATCEESLRALREALVERARRPTR